MPKIYVPLPCKPLVKQYIHNRYGNPVVYPKYDWLHKIVERLLQRPDTKNAGRVGFQYYTDQVLLPITIHTYQRYGNELNATGIQFLNNTIQDIINETLYEFLEVHYRQANTRLADAIELFREKYLIPEEAYTTAAIIKYYQRARKRKEQNFLVPKTSFRKN